MNKPTDEQFENPYDRLARRLFKKYQKDYKELCNSAVLQGFDKPKDPLESHTEEMPLMKGTLEKLDNLKIR